MIVKCDRCEAISPNGSEYDTELWFNTHDCKGMRDLGELPLDLLRKLALGEISEAEAWKQAKSNS